jgi:hypothetical protein
VEFWKNEGHREPRPPTPISRPWALAATLLALFGILALCIFFFLTGKHTGNAAAPVAVLPSERIITDKKFLCAVEYSSAALVQSAYRRWDLEAMNGLVSRGKAIYLEKGTEVAILKRERGIATIAIESGSEIGERCWLPEVVLIPGVVNIK